MTCRTTRIKFLLLTILFLGTASQTFAADGDLDTSFGNGGFVITDTGSSSESIRDLAVQPDGKIIAIGNSFVGSTHQTTVVRYNSNGSIDSSFGIGGKVMVQNVFPYELALQSNGKIVFVGTSGLSTTGAAANSDFYVARLNSDGTFDSSGTRFAKRFRDYPFQCRRFSRYDVRWRRQSFYDDSADGRKCRYRCSRSSA